VLCSVLQSTVAVLIGAHLTGEESFANTRGVAVPTFDSHCLRDFEAEGSELVIISLATRGISAGRIAEVSIVAKRAG
jgi:hypothetical protein